MGFVTPALLGGALLVGVPIVLHLIMRREAQHLLFPALRFVERRQSLNQHRLRLRQWLLLALRCAIIALLAFALARPVLRGSGAAGREGAPVATALIFDNSLRMEYQHENQSRLEQSKELATWLLAQLPPDTPVAVFDRASRQRTSDGARDAAELRVERLTTSGAVRPLRDALRDAAEWLAEQKDYRGEIYVFTDLAAEDWGEESLADIKSRLDTLPGTNLYLIDVGVARAQNIGLAPLRLSSQKLSPRGTLKIDTELVSFRGTGSVDGAAPGAALGDSSQGTTPQSRQVSPKSAPATDRLSESSPNEVPPPPPPVEAQVVVELYVNDGTGAPVKRGQQVVAPRASGGTPIEFSLSNLALGTHQGYLRILSSDALPFDDIRYFSIDVEPPSKVLLLGEAPDDVIFLREALAPSAAPGQAQSRFDCTSALFDDWQGLALDDFDAICLVDPPPLADELWQALTDFANGGGGVGVFLGRHARRDPFNEAAAQELLPAKLRWVSRDATYLRPMATEHPALAELQDFADIAPWSEFPVFKYWELEAGAEPAHMIAPFANDKPAIVERVVGAGRVVMMTTSVSDRAHDDPWNLLPTGPDPWPFLMLANGVAEYLTGAGDGQLNYLAGQAVLLRLDPEEQTTSYVLQMPEMSALRQTLTPGQSDLSITSTEKLGNYRLRAGGQEGRLDRGFSVNAAPELSRLERIEPEAIAAALGEDRVRAARNAEEIEVRVGLGRVGRELYPLLILGVALVLGAEQLLANRFYASREPEARGRA